MESHATLKKALRNGSRNWYKVIRFTGKTNISAFLNLMRRNLEHFSDAGLSFDYQWWIAADDVAYLAITGNRTSLVVLDFYMSNHSKYISDYSVMFDGRGKVEFETLVTELMRLRVLIKGKHTIGVSR